MKKTIGFIIVIVLLHGCVSVRKTEQEKNTTISGIKLIGEYDITHNQPFLGTTIGGLSGIDYHAEKNEYYLISDDRSAINDARYYTAKIFFNQSGIDSVVFTRVTILLDKTGKPYPNSKQDPAHTPDPEAIRYNPINGTMFWTSEGERILRGKDTVLENPAISVMSVDGKYIDTFPLPPNLLMHAIEKGPRQNGVLEGMSFANAYRTLYINVEEPLYEDGPRADVMENNAFIRIYQFDVATKKNTAQYAYQLDPVAYPSTPVAGFKINGVPDILSIGKNQLLVLERSFSTGRLPCTIKIFITELQGATNIMNTASLKETPAAKPATKKLLLNMDSLGIYIDNVEGVTFGPTLPNGHKTLVLVADNNFAVFQKTQFFVFEIIP